MARQSIPIVGPGRATSVEGTRFDRRLRRKTADKGNQHFKQRH